MWTPKCHKTVNPEAVGRIVSVQPKSGDALYFWLLLRISYEDLRTIEGIQRPHTNQCALYWIFVRATRNGLIVSTKQFLCMFLGYLFQLFTNLLLCCQSLDPLSIHTQYWDATYERRLLRSRQTVFLFNRGSDSTIATEWFGIGINPLFGKLGTTNADFNIPVQDHMLPDVSIIEDEMDHDASAGTCLKTIIIVSMRGKTIFDSLCNGV